MNRTAMNRVRMALWLSVPEFSDIMTQWMYEGKVINDSEILPVLKNIYREKKKARDEGAVVNFAFGAARHGINQIEKSLGIPHEEL